MSHVLIVDDEPAICWGIGRLARSMGHEVEIAPSAEQGLARAGTRAPDVLVLDVRLPGLDGLSAMAAFRSHMGDRPIIVITAFGDLGTATKAMDNGAFDYVVKPFDLAEIRTALERSLRSERVNLDAERASRPQDEGMLGATPAMQAVFKRMALASKSEAPVLLRGETGAGKELAALSIHRSSAHKGAGFVAVNAGSLAPATAEAELFGYAAGALAGVTQVRKGLLAQANGGTLFLDEVADIPPPLQVKLLRVMEQGEFMPIGSEQPVPTRFRLIAATRRDLLREVQSGNIRDDFFFRICTFEIDLPPLRERAEDIRLLAKHFAGQIGGANSTLTEETLAELERRQWFGNVRELRGAIEHALVLARSGAVLPAHLPRPLPRWDALDGSPFDADPQAGDLVRSVGQLAESLLAEPELAGAVYDRFLEKVEPPLLAAAMNQSGRRCASAARALGLHRTTLKRKLDQYGIDQS